MDNMMSAMKANSDQMNFVDIGADGEIIITIERVDYDPNREQQQIWIYYAGCGRRPYKPSLGMRRILIGAWGGQHEGRDWVGKSIQLYGEKNVTFGKSEVGGIRIRALSHIPKEGYTAYVQKNKRVRTKQTIPLFEPVAVVEELTQDDQGWIDAIRVDASLISQLNEGPQKEKIKKHLAL